MAENQHQDLSEVETLLGSRQQLHAWLEKLDAAGSKTPTAVRERVRADYQGRLAQVVDQLRGHSDVISGTLKGLQGQAEEFEALRAEEQETLAEAELRHSVGEYSDAEWNRVEADCSGKLGGMDEEIGRLTGEIRRLDEVLTQIAPPAPPPPALRRKEPEPVVIRPPEPPPVVVVEHLAAPVEAAPIQPPEHIEAPRFVPRGGLKSRESGPVRTVQFPSPSSREAAPASAPVDELTFLKSMTLENKSPDRSSANVAKTLKCGECGALNRPTEWYCDRCGAELAAV